MEKTKHILSNYIWLPILLTIGFFGWVCKIDFITVPFLCVYAGVLLALCDDVRNIFPIVFAVPFFINPIEKFSDYVILGVGIICFLIGVVIFLIRHLCIKKTPVHKGKLFWGFVVSLVAYLIGGIAYFNILNALIIIAMTAVTYFLYWVAINFTKNLKNYLGLTFILIGAILAIQLFISYLMVDEPFSSAILSKNVIWIGLQNINVVAIYFMLAMLSVFQRALKHRLDYLLTLAGMLFAICVYFTYSRMGTLICFILMLVGIIYIFIKSKNKPIFLFMGIVGVFAINIICLFWFDKIEKLFTWHSSLGLSGNGREKLWPWCLEKFIRNPIFGIGFTSKDPVPSVSADTIVLAHNTVLQYLTSLGIVGTILMAYYFVQRYKIIFAKFNEFKFMNLLSVLAIFLSGITDQSPTMDIFIISISVILVALAEQDTEEILSKTTQHSDTLGTEETLNNSKQDNDTRSHNETKTNNITRFIKEIFRSKKTHKSVSTTEETLNSEKAIEATTTKEILNDNNTTAISTPTEEIHSTDSVTKKSSKSPSQTENLPNTQEAPMPILIKKPKTKKK